jgi:ABC-type multidrug transport system ATPase subunit
MSEANLLDARRLTKFEGQRKVVDEVSLSVNRGEIVGLLGRAHAGKSTTLRMLTGALKPDGGTLRIQGEILTSVPAVPTVSGPSILILDEPFAGLGPEDDELLKSRILRLAGQGVGVLFADEDVRGALDWCDRAYVLGGGRVVSSGSASGLLAPL